MNTPRKGNDIVTLSVPTKKVKELKLKALQNDMTLSDFMVKSACEVTSNTLQSESLGEPEKVK